MSEEIKNGTTPEVRSEQTAPTALERLKAAKEAGFTTVAVEDAASAKDRDAIRAAADYYIAKGGTYS